VHNHQNGDKKAKTPFSDKSSQDDSFEPSSSPSKKRSISLP